MILKLVIMYSVPLKSKPDEFVRFCKLHFSDSVSYHFWSQMPLAKWKLFYNSDFIILFWNRRCSCTPLSQTPLLIPPNVFLRSVIYISANSGKCISQICNVYICLLILASVFLRSAIYISASCDPERRSSWWFPIPILYWWPIWARKT